MPVLGYGQSCSQLNRTLSLCSYTELMWLLHSKTLRLRCFEGDNIPKYGILSHRWEDGEVSFQQVQARNFFKPKGWQKIKQCYDLARKDGINWIWADTCCIDKRSSAELSEAINSMYRWYNGAEVCYAYLCDICAASTSTGPPKTDITSS